MSQVLITGGSGFLGAALARHLLLNSEQEKTETRRHPWENPSKALPELLLTDRSAPPADLADHPRVRHVAADLLALLQASGALLDGVTHIVHLAAAVSAECEADFDLGLRSNLATTQALLEAARALGTQPTFVFASSLAVFGSGPGLPRPALIDDFNLPTPQGSYGIQKFIGEQLVADYGRKGYIRARSVRPMTVCVRPGAPNGAASGFLSGMIREPLAGLRARVPVRPDLAVALASPANTVRGLATALWATDAAWGPLTAVNLPALRTTVGEMAEALRRAAGQSTFDFLDWQPDPAIERLVSSWPAHVACNRARGLGLVPDQSFDAIVAQHISR